MLKRLFSFITAATLVLAMAGCAPTAAPDASTAPSNSTPASTDNPDTEAPKEKTTIKFVGNAGSVAGFEQRAAEFMKLHPDIIVEVQGIPANSWGELLQAITINIAGGDIPDIADIASEGQRAFAVSDIIVPLDEFIARDADELSPTLDAIHPNLMEAMKYEGKTYSLPTVWNNMCLYYNKNVLREFGIPEPTADWTIDDFLKICQTVISKNDGKNDRYGYAFGNGYFVTLVPWMLVSGGNVMNEGWTASNLTNPDTIAAVQLLNNFIHKYKISPKIDAGVADFDLFVQDKLAFMGAGMWNVNALKNAGFTPEDYDVINFPKIKTNDVVMGVGGAPIFKASKNKEAAWEFAKFLSSKEFQETFVVEDGWSIPSVKSAADVLATKPFAPANSEIFYAAADNGVMVPAPQEYGFIEATLLREVGAAFAGMKTVPEALKIAEDEINKEIAKRK